MEKVHGLPDNQLLLHDCVHGRNHLHRLANPDQGGIRCLDARCSVRGGVLHHRLWYRAYVLVAPVRDSVDWTQHTIRPGNDTVHDNLDPDCLDEEHGRAPLSPVPAGPIWVAYIEHWWCLLDRHCRPVQQAVLAVHMGYLLAGWTISRDHHRWVHHPCHGVEMEFVAYSYCERPRVTPLCTLNSEHPVSSTCDLH